MLSLNPQLYSYPPKALQQVQEAALAASARNANQGASGRGHSFRLFVQKHELEDKTRINHCSLFSAADVEDAIV